MWKSSRGWLGRAIVVGAGLLLASWGVSLLITSSREEAGLKLAREQVGTGRFAEARPWLEARARTTGASPEVCYWLGVCAHATGSPSDALKAWARVPMTSPFGAQAALARAQTEVGDFGRYEAAEPLLKSVLQVKGPEARVARQALSQLAFYQGRLDEMRALLEEGWSRSDNRSGDLRDHWRIDSAAISLDEVRAEVERAALLDPRDDRVWLARANLAILTGNQDEALKQLDACLERRPDDPAVWLARLRWSRAFDHLGEFRRALARIPSTRFSAAERHEISAWIASREGRPDDQRKALELLVQREPGATAALEQLAVLASESGRLAESAAYRARKAKADDANERYMRLLEDGGPLSRPGRFAELGQLAEALGRRFEAKGWWTLAVVDDRGSASAAESLARLERQVPPSVPAIGLGLASEAAPSEPPVVEGGQGLAPRFVDLAERARLRFAYENGRSPLRQLPETSGGGIGLLDYDGDGWLDVYLVQGGPFPPEPNRTGGDRLFRNRGDGAFEDVTERSGLSGLVRGYGHGVSVADFDNDGDPDLFLTRWRAYALYRNRGDGTFEDATIEAGLGGDRGWPTSAAFADLDNDGDLDLYVCHYADWNEQNPSVCPRTTEGLTTRSEDGSPNDYCNPNPFPAQVDHLFRNDDGRFVDLSETAGITAADRNGRGFGVVAADVDDDGRIDLFVSNDTTANYLFLNKGGLVFDEVGLQAGVATGTTGGYQAGMGVACGDLNGDGRFDLLVTNFYGESTTFYQNLGGGSFTDRSSAIGLTAPSRFLLGFGIVLFDFNNDGHLDIATANGHVNDMRPRFPLAMPMSLLAGTHSQRLVDVSERAGADVIAPRVGRALVAGDLDNDGRLDLLVQAHDRPIAFLHNETDPGRWLSVRLEGTDSNKDAVGARVTVWAGGTRQVAQRSGGGSFQSSGDPRAHFGLGAATRAETVEIQWPSGRADRFQNLDSGSYLIREGSTEAVDLSRSKHIIKSE